MAEQNCADFDFLNINWSNFKITGQNCVKLGSKQAQTCVFAFTKLKPDFFSCMHGYCWLPVGGVKALFGQAVGPQVQHVGVLVDLFLFFLEISLVWRYIRTL